MEFTLEELENKASSIKPIEFTQETLRKTLSEHGLEKVAEDLARTYEKGNENFFTYETLLDGTAPILNLEFEPEEVGRPRSPEDILVMFSNTRDFKGSGTSAFATGIKEKAVPAIGMGAGAFKGAQAGARLAAIIPPIGPAPILAKGALILGGGLLGGIFGDTLFRKADDAVFGEDDPVAPSLKGAYNAGETLAYGGSMLWAPYRLPAKEGFFGATRFLDNFQRARNPNFVGPIQLSSKMLKRAQSAKKPDSKSGEIYETLFTGPKARFKPDPTKGPVNARILASLEKGVVKAGESARANPLITAAIEGLAVAGASGSNLVSDKLFPDSDVARLGGEIVGSLAPGAGMKLLVGAGVLAKDSVEKIISTVANIGTKGQTDQIKLLAKDKYKKEAAKRLYEAFENAAVQSNGSYTINDVLDVYNPQKITRDGTIQELPQTVLDKTGKRIEFVPSGEGVEAVELAEGAGAPFAKRVQDIADVVNRTSDELAVASKSGREAYIVKAKQLILDFNTIGDPDSLRAAAEIQEQLDRIGIELQLKESQERLLNAANRVLGEEGEYGSAQLNLSEKIFNNLNATFNESKNKMRRLYNEVGEMNIPSFAKIEKDANGNDIRVELEEPSFLTVFDTIGGDGIKSPSRGSQRIFEDAMGPLMQDIKKAKELFRGEGVEETASVISNFTKAFNREQNSPAGVLFNKLNLDRLNRIKQNSPDFDGLSETDALENITNSPSERNIAFLQETADSLRKNKDTASKNAAKLFDLKADEILDRYDTTIAVTDAPNTTPELFTIKGLNDFRGDLLDKARDLKTTKPKLSAKFSTLAKAVLNDLNAVDGIDAESYHRARAYAKAHNDVFSRTFAGDPFDMERSGAARIDPSQLLNKLFAGGSSPTYMRLKQIQNANIFGVKQQLPGAEDRVFEMHESLEMAVRDVRRQIMDPTTGKVSKASLDTFKKQPAVQETLSLFPALADDLQSLEKAQALVDSVDESVKIFKNSEGYKRVNRLLGENNENPSSEIALAVRSKAPTNALNEIYDLVVKDPTGPGVGLDIRTKAGREAKQLQQENSDGLKSAIFNYATIASGGEGQSFSADKFNKVLFEKIKNSDISLAEWMKGKGLINESEKTLLQQALKDMKQVEEAFRTGELENVLFKNPTGIKMFATKILGATTGKIGQQRLERVIERLTGGNIRPSGGLIAESEGSKQLQNFVLKTPEVLKVKAMTELLQDSEMLGVLLRKIDSEKSADSIMKKIQTFLTSKGIRSGLSRVPYVIRSEGEDIERAKLLEGAKLSETDRERTLSRQENIKSLQQEETTIPPVSDASPSMNAVRGGPQPVAQATPPASPPAQADPQTRQRYAALFPNDPTSAMIKGSQGGIGSLFG